MADGLLSTPPLAWAAPFVLLLFSIALFPVAAPKWWAKWYGLVAIPLGVVVSVYYVFFRNGMERMLHTGHEYVSFIALIGSLYVVTGGMHVRLTGRLNPGQNVMLLGIGAVIANIVGTTGAAMLLIRPYLRGNAWRFAPFHIAFFIFIVANCGGALTPIGDPPLFLGYLKGVPFFWTLTALWYKWLIGVGMLLAIFYFLDRREYFTHSRTLRMIAEQEDKLGIEGKRNFFLIAVVVGAAFIQRPLFLREAVMIGAAVASYVITPRPVHDRNGFSFHPVLEVAVLFAGIFATMVPALDWLAANAESLGIRTATQYYWMTGSLSAVLDNAPTYLNFLTAAMGVEHLSADNPAQVASFAAKHADILRSISISAVYFGAATYIGNGPNFLCKSICEQTGLPTPTFMQYIYRYALPFLLPVLIVTYVLVVL